MRRINFYFLPIAHWISTSQNDAHTILAKFYAFVRGHTWYIQ